MTRHSRPRNRMRKHGQTTSHLPHQQPFSTHHRAIELFGLTMKGIRRRRIISKLSNKHSSMLYSRRAKTKVSVPIFRFAVKYSLLVLPSICTIEVLCKIHFWNYSKIHYEQVNQGFARRRPTWSKIDHLLN